MKAELSPSARSLGKRLPTRRRPQAASQAASPAWPESAAPFPAAAFIPAPNGSNLRENIFQLQKMVRSQPEDAMLRLNLMLQYRRLGDHDTALREVEKALNIDAESAVAKFNKGCLMLMQGEYDQGWALFEHRFAAYQRLDTLGEHTAKYLAIQRIFPTQRQWRGKSLAGKSLLVWTEQGVGDNIMMMRYLPLLTAQAKKVYVLTDPPLRRLFFHNFKITKICESVRAVPDFDWHCPMMSLPLAFDTTLATIPGRRPYLAADDPARTKGKKRVGLCWAGNPHYEDDYLRSLSIEQLKPLFEAEVQFVNLKKGFRVAGMDNRVNDAKDFMDTAKIIAGCDLIISVDTAIVHLAGAMGRPVWMLNRLGSEWRWGVNPTRSPWYPSMKIFNQKLPIDWSPTILEMAKELMAWASR
ncbi:MAG TPA: glycosyltransferase family 9 protein [Opitutales bacterium]|nr:glycosyltransferase family 9 protein [Opitutales bacterium]